MRVLLLAMPDTVSALDAIIRVPNLGLCSIAGNLKDCDVKIIDLAFHSRGITRFLNRFLESYRPELIGLSAMSFQFASACRVAGICREVCPEASIVLGGYHATLMFEEIAGAADGKLFDFIIRGEGESAFDSLMHRLDGHNRHFEDIQGLSFKTEYGWRHNAPATLLDLDHVALPARSCRVIDNARFLGQPFDCVETSRGCTMGCRFCSINHMYGRCIREFKLERVISDLKNLKQAGKKGIFFVDDNITLNVPRFKTLCDLIAKGGLNTMSYVVQASVAGIAADPDLAVSMKRAGFNWVFLGIESGIDRNLRSMGKRGVLENTQRAVSLLKKQGIGIFGGFIVGHPGDTAEDIRSTFSFAFDLGVDHPIVQSLTPYPRTETRDDLMAKGLVTNTDDYSQYNGFTINVKTDTMTSAELGNAVFRGSLRYFSPRYLVRSRFWKYNPSSWPALVANNFRYSAGARKGKIFTSRHVW